MTAEYNCARNSEPSPKGVEITKTDVVKGLVGLVTGGPLGVVLSPVVGRVFTDKTWAWALIGVVAGPFAWAIFGVPIALVASFPKTADKSLSNAPAAIEEIPAPAPPKAVARPPAEPPIDRIPVERVPEPSLPKASDLSLDAPIPDNPIPAPPVQREVSSGPTNTSVADYLNSADQSFKDGMDGCGWVASAISVANKPESFGPTSSAQREELRKYVARCNLRY